MINFNVFIENLKNANEIVFDTETTGFNAYDEEGYPFLLQIGIVLEGHLEVTLLGLEPYGCFKAKEKKERDLCPDLLDEEEKEILSQTLISLMKKKVLFIGHNIKFDLHMLFQYFKWDIYNSKDIKASFFDTMVFFKVCHNNTFKVSLEDACEFYKISKKDDGVDIWKKKNRKLMLKDRYDYIDFNIMNKYAKQDIVSTHELYKAINDNINQYIKDDLVDKEAFLKMIKIEIDVTKVLFFMERRGIALDLEHLMKCKAHLEEAVFEKELDFYSIMENNSPMGGEFFTDSADNIERYYRYCGITLDFRLTSGILCTSEGCLIKYKIKLTDIIISLRKLKKQLSTYINGILESSTNGIVRTKFFQTGADTMRMSAKDPGIQTIPKEDGEFALRACFKAKKGFLYSVDFAAQEARIALILGNEQETIQKVIHEKLDLHGANAKLMNTSRSNAKGVFFGFLYGSGGGVIASELDISYSEAMIIKNKLKNALPNLVRYNYALIDCVKENGYVTTLFGNPLFIDENFAYKALNYKIQGSCASIMKIALIEWDKVANDYDDGYPLLAIHDEIVAEFENVPSHEIKEKFLNCFRGAYELMDAEFSEPMKNWKKC